MTEIAADDRYLLAAPAADTTAIVFDFPLDADTDLRVTRLRAGTSAALALNTDFTVAIDGEDGGTVTLASASLAADQYAIDGRAELTRDSDYQYQAAIDSAALDADFSRFTLIVQELRSGLDRALGRLFGFFDAAGLRIGNLADPTGDQDAATKAYVDVTAGAIDVATVSAAATTATNAATAAAGSADDAADSAAAAEAAAAAAEGTVTGVSSFNARTGAVVPAAGDYDAFYYTEAEVDAALADKADDAALTAGLATKEPLGELVGIRTITASAILELADKGKVVEGNHASTAIVVTVPPNADVAFPVNSRIDLVRYGAGAMSVAAGSGVTVRSAGSVLGISDQYGAAQLYKRATDEWVLIGSLS